ncbi:2-hydroxy-3-keto-5-methylthiopentenyl-1-phosphate phosphatase [Alkalicoccobacillus murimartini]|uniref:2-hydroxy-3-keto-5-methylthiopentenyl-1-phosphate phosphatase n=1 Tax=Alkalicoccobacillus murimartini TaxID=171685 RepID=A0ABT9YJH1_9BACI|nr:2-hydroxy-3-keto-5-methylthiopentenyl-1-phosphate phosphatase [Alkalicoccobacillus murimartini]MDQ0207977.1 2-hydroxy-3-keto-5-methylthiopentenyl-1-phosphate phosphatase [Alkalicoccobacillus murimartini]
MTQIAKKTPIIFCDFDGTITTKDNIIAIMKKFAPPGWETIKDDILAERISIRTGVGQLFDLIPVEQKQDIINFVLAQAEIREGFSSFLEYVREKQIPLKVVSGGIDFFVQPILEPYGLLENLYCNGSDFSEKTIVITWPHSCDKQCTNDCGCCKPSILRQFQDEDYYKIVIGDSITDLQAAKEADEVFACDSFLLDKCRELQLNHSFFTTFHEIIDRLDSKLEVSKQ